MTPATWATKVTADTQNDVLRAIGIIRRHALPLTDDGAVECVCLMHSADPTLKGWNGEGYVRATVNRAVDFLRTIDMVAA